MRAAQYATSLFSFDSASRASAGASIAIDAAGFVNLVLAVVFSDCTYRAGPSAGTAADAFVLVNFVCHCQYTSLQICNQQEFVMYGQTGQFAAVRKRKHPARLAIDDGNKALPVPP